MAEELFTQDLTHEMDWGQVTWQNDHGETVTTPASGEAVQKYIKGPLINSRIGYLFNVSKEQDNSNYLYGFANEDDFTEWRRLTNDGNENLDSEAAKKYVLTSCIQPKATPQPYYTTALRSMEDTKDIVSVGDEIKIKIQFTAIDYQLNSSKNQLIPEYQRVSGTLKGQIRNQDGTWTNLDMSGVQTNIESVLNESNSTEVNISNAITREESLIRLYVESRTTNNEIVTTNYIQFNIIKTNVTVSNATQWYSIIDLSESMMRKINLQYYVSGIVDKTLVVKISGNKNQSYGAKTEREIRANLNKTSYTSTPYNIELRDTNDPMEYKVCAHGIHDIEAYIEIWVNGNLIRETSHIYSQIYVKAEEDNNIYAVVNNLNKNPINWTSYSDKPLFEYVILGGASATVNSNVNTNIKFLDINTNESYLSIENNIQKGVIQKFTNSLEIDHNNNNIETYLTISVDIDENLENELFRTVIVINNEGGYAPTAGAEFIFNPKKYDNSSFDGIKVNENNTGYIINEADDNKIDATYTNFEFNSDAFVYNNEFKSRCLSVLTGQELNINYNPFKNCETQCAIEFTYMIKNVIDENVPVFRIAADDGDNFYGLKLYPYKGLMYTPTSRNELSQDVWLAPNQIINFAIIVNKGNNSASTQDENDSKLVYIYINGIVNRVFELTAGDISNFNKFNNLNIIIGNKNDCSDIDIYNLRVYNNKSLKHSQILQNYISNALTIEEKERIKKSNSITNNNQLIDIGKCEEYGYNTLTWKPISDTRCSMHGKDTYVVGKHAGDKEDTYQYGDLVIKIYNTDASGNPILDKEKSGTITNLRVKGQGTSSMNYWKWNQRWEFSKIAAANTPDPNADDYDDYVEEEDKNKNPYWAIASRFFSLNDYPNGPIFPHDTDNYKEEIKNAKDAYQLEKGDPWAKRLDAKINWASPMQSHKMGSVNLYNDIWKKVIKNSELTTYGGGESFTGTSNGYKDCRVAIRQKPFLLFEQKTISTLPEFFALFTMGPSKGDKPTFGYNKKDFPDYIMMEGTDNSRNLINCRVPWNDIDISFGDALYIDKDEKTWEVSMGDDDVSKCSFMIEVDNKTIKNPNINPVIAKFKDLINFCYECRINIAGYNGTFDEFNNEPTNGGSSKTSDGAPITTKNMYWMNKGNINDEADKPYNLYRYDPRSTRWVHAGIEYDDTKTNPTQYVDYKPYNLITNLNDKSKEFENSITKPGTTLSEKNLLFQRDRIYKYRGVKNGTKITLNSGGNSIYVAEGGINDYVNKEDLMYSLQLLKLIAASDNWAKNTYIYNPGIYEEDMNGDIVRTHGKDTNDKDGEIVVKGAIIKVGDNVKQYGAARIATKNERGDAEIQKYKLVSKFRFFQDDLDTIFSLDNKGLKIKPYYVDENDMKDFDTYWNAEENPLFKNAYYAWDDLMGEICEFGKDENKYMKTMMHAILNSMQSTYDEIKNNINPTLALAPESDKVLACWDAYYGTVTKYLPAIAYNEIIRLLYVRAHNYPGYNGTAPALPLTQAVGDQYVGEKEWFRRRSILFSSYAEVGEFESRDGAGSDGVLSFRADVLPDKNDPRYKYKAKPYQYLWFSIADGQNKSVYPLEQRRYSPDEYAEMNWTTGDDVTQMIRGINYVKEINDFGGIKISPDESAKIVGGKILNFSATPEGTQDIYGSGKENPYRSNILFGSPVGIIFVNTPLLKSINITGIPIEGNEIKGEMNLNDESSKLYKLRNVDVTGTRISSLILPNPNNIESLKIPSTVTTLTLKGSSKLNEDHINILNENNQSVGYENIETIDIDNCKSIDRKNLIENILNNPNNKLSKLIVGEVNWTGTDKIDISFLQKLMKFDESNLSLTGEIELDGYMGADLKLDLLNRFGEIDNKENDLYIKYNIISVNEEGIRINGPTNIYTFGNYKFTLNYPSDITGVSANDFTNIKWSILSNTNNNIDLNNISVNEKGVLTIGNQFSFKNLGENPQITLRCEITRMPGLNGIQPPQKVIDKVISLTQPRAKIGDYLYADKTYGPPINDTGEKPIVGICIYADNTDDAETQRRIAVATNMIKSDYNGDMKSTANCPFWGRYYNNIYVDFSTPNYTNTVSATIMSGYNMGVTGAIPSGWGHTNGMYLIHSSYAPTDIIGDIINKHPNYKTDSYYNSDKHAVLDFGFIKDNSDVFIPKGRQHTNDMLNAANNLRNNTTYANLNLRNLDNWQNVSITGSSKYAESKFEFINMVFKSGAPSALSGDDVKLSNTIYIKDSYYYPAAQYCNAYQPDIEDLHNDLKEGNWFLPSAGELVRAYIYAIKTMDFNEMPNYAVGCSMSFGKLKTLIEKNIADNSLNLKGHGIYDSRCICWSSTESNNNDPSAFAIGYNPSNGNLEIYNAKDNSGYTFASMYGEKSNCYNLWPMISF